MTQPWFDLLWTLPRRVLILGVRGYRLLLKPWLGNACRFEPTCSAYALQALQQHGAVGGTALTGWRILRCHPWCDGGCDPVPDNFPRLRAGLFTRWVSPTGTPGLHPEAGPAGAGTLVAERTESTESAERSERSEGAPPPPAPPSGPPDNVSVTGKFP